MVPNNPLIPSRVTEITPTWISSVLNLSNPINLSSFKVTPNANEGNGFLSNLARVEFEMDVKNNSPTEDVKYNLIVKLLPDATVAGTLDLVLVEKLDITEVKSYAEFFQDVLTEIPDLKKYVCEHYYTRIQDEVPAEGIPYASVMVLKDMRPEGFAIIPFRHGYDPSLFAEGLDFTVKLHVGSRCLERQRGQILTDVYPWLSKYFLPIDQQRPGYVPQIHAYFDGGFEATYKVLSEHSKNPDRYIAAYKGLEPIAKETYQRILEAGQKVRTGIHGDLWGPNILINREAKDSRMKIIDWQFFGYADPAFDMAIYIMMVLPLEKLDQVHIFQAARDYYSLYTDLCKSKGLTVERLVEEFLEFFKTFGIAYYLFILFPGCHLLAGMEGVMPKLIRLLELIVEMNVVDFLMKL